MERKRSRMSIIYDMLILMTERKGRIKPTHLMYKANLSHKQMKGYLEDLSKSGLIEKVEKDSKNVIAITKKGQDFVSKLSQIREFENTFGI